MVESLSVVVLLVIGVNVEVLCTVAVVDGIIDVTMNVVDSASVVAVVTGVDALMLVIDAVVDGTIDVTMTVVELVSVV